MLLIRWRLLFASFVLNLLLSAFVGAAVFGDGDPGNGVEDARQLRSQADNWPQAFDAVGRVRCGEQVTGSAVLLDMDSRPLILTAAHVLDAGADCFYLSAGGVWPGALLLESVERGRSPADADLPKKYERDWVLAEIAPWAGWQRSSLNAEQIADKVAGGRAHMVGFDQATDQMAAHVDCRFGPAAQSPLLAGTRALLWDDCHSMGGASGGALFVETPQGMRLLAIRIGSLYRPSAENTPPNMGERFDLELHINVSRRVADLLN